jgi:hypothetical protein
VSPFCALHVTRVACRTSIQDYGIVGNAPRGRPWGVYVFSDDIRHDPGRPVEGGPPARWHARPGMDVWQVNYIGPMMNDTYVENGVILLESVPATGVTLVTCNNE